MAIKELSVFYKQFEAEQAAARERARRRRIDPDLLPRDVLARLEPDYRHFEILPLEEARSLEASDTVRLFLERKGRWEAVPNLRRREPGQKALAFRRLPRETRAGGGTPRKPKKAALPSMANASSFQPAPSVSITRPGQEILELGKGGDFGRQITYHTVREGDTVESIATLLTGRPNPRALIDYHDGSLIRKNRPLRIDAIVRVHTGTTLLVGGGASNTDTVTLEWTGPTTGRETVAAESGWEHRIPVQPGRYTLTVRAGEARDSRMVQILRPEKPKQTEVAVRIGVFFDGTGNNRENDIPRGTDTNIARLFELYQVNPGEETVNPVGQLDGMDLYTHRFYQHGVGTITGKKNNDLAMGTGAGGVSRIEKAMSDIENFLLNFSDREGPRIVDVFGFSRGAALARDFVNRVNERLSRQGVRVGFVGLFDTVSSFGIPGNDIDIRSDSPLLTPVLGGLAAAAATGSFNFDLGPESALKVVHLVAGNEYRSNFPLQSLRPGPGRMPPGNIEEIAVPGAHADVGGGYGPEVMMEYRRLKRREIHYRTVGPVRQWQAALLAQKTELENEAAGQGARLVYEGTQKNAVDEAIDIYWFVRERPIKPGLSNVYLHAMYKKAEDAGVPMLSIRDMAENNPARFGIPPELISLFTDDCITPRNEPQILNHYAHRSDIDWTNADGLTEWLANRGGEPGERTVFYNEPENAIKPARPAQKATMT